MYFKGNYLRVLTPRTTNGVVPKLINGEQQWKETFLPITAKKQIEKKNNRLKKNGFSQLVAEIEVIGDETAETITSSRRNPKPKKFRQ